MYAISLEIKQTERYLTRYVVTRTSNNNSNIKSICKVLHIYMYIHFVRFYFECNGV